MHEICQDSLPVRPWDDARLNRLPGLVPVEPGDWLQVDDAYAAQMARRAALLADQRDAVLAYGTASGAALQELQQLVLDALARRGDFQVAGGVVTCPDARRVRLDPARPLENLGALVQEDFCLLEKPPGGAEHVLTGGLLCFPASWLLAEKLGRPLTSIHSPVASYSPDMARRVQRLFDGVQPERPIWRANCLLYDDPELHQPRSETAPRPPASQGRKWVRIERQSIVKLAGTGAVVFSIHTYQRRLENLPADDQAAISARFDQSG